MPDGGRQVAGGEEPEDEEPVRAVRPEGLGHRTGVGGRGRLLAEQPDPGGRPQKASVRGEFAREDLQEGGLPGAVRAGDQEPFARVEVEGVEPEPSLHPDVHEVYGRALAREVRAEPEGFRGCGHGVGGEPGEPFAGGPDAAHGAVRPRPGPEGAGPAERGRGLAGDRGEPVDVGVREGRVPGEFGPPLLVLPHPARPFGGASGQVAGVAVAVAAQGAAVLVHLQDRGGDPVEEDAVVGDGDDRAPVGAQPLLQPGHGLVVEVVGGLVEQQQLGLGGEHGGEREPGPLSAGERSEGPVAVERAALPEPPQRRLHPPVGPGAAPRLVRGEQPGVSVEVAGRGECGLGGPDGPLQLPYVREGVVDGVPDGGLRGEVQGLGEVPETAGGFDGHVAVVGGLQAGEEPQEGGLPGAVVPDDAEAFAGTDGEGDAVEHGAEPGAGRVVALGDVGELGTEQGRSPVRRRRGRKWTRRLVSFRCDDRTARAGPSQDVPSRHFRRTAFGLPMNYLF